MTTQAPSIDSAPGTARDVHLLAQFRVSIKYWPHVVDRHC